jgi:hypothetical protein
VRNPAIWFDVVSLALLADLARHVPELRDRLHAARPTENGQDGPSGGPRLFNKRTGGLPGGS